MIAEAPPKTLKVQQEGTAWVIRRRLARRIGVFYLLFSLFILLMLPTAAQDIVPTPDRVLLLIAIAAPVLVFFVLRGLHNLLNVAVYRIDGHTMTITQQPLRFSHETYDLANVSQLEVATHRSGFRDPTTYYGVIDRMPGGRERWLIRLLKRDEAHFLRDLLAHHLGKPAARPENP